MSFAIALRLSVGWFCIAVGVLDLVVELDRNSGSPNRPYVFFHVTLLVGGVMLLALDWLAPKPGGPGYVTGGAILLGGTLLSAIPATTTICCMVAFPVRHGFPFTFTAREPGQRWHIDSQHLLADLLFWGFLGLLILVVVGLFRQSPQPAGEPADGPAEQVERQYIEHRYIEHPSGAPEAADERRPEAAEEQQAEQKTVGPLP
jgi:hypothetical protein